MAKIDYTFRIEVTGPEGDSLPPDFPVLRVDSAPHEVQGFERFWLQRSAKSHEVLLKWVKEFRLTRHIEKPAPRSLEMIRLMLPLSDSQYKSWALQNEGQIQYAWSKLCSTLLESASQQVETLVDDVHANCWGSLRHAEDFDTLRNAVTMMMPLLLNWKACPYGVALLKIELVYKIWRNAEKCLDAHRVDAECLDTVRNTKGRVKQRNASQRMVKKLMPLDRASLPPLMEKWVAERLDYWQTQLLLVSIPEDDKPKKPRKTKKLPMTD